MEKKKILRNGEKKIVPFSNLKPGDIILEEPRREVLTFPKREDTGEGAGTLFVRVREC